MNCHNHPEVPATGVCAQCGKGICQACTVNLGGRYYCVECSKNPIQPMAQPAQPQAGYQQYQPYGYYVPPKTSNGLCIAGMILGILSLITSWCYGGGFLFGLAGLIMGAIGVKQVKQQPDKQTGSGMGVAGIVTGSLGVLISLIIIIIAIAAIASVGSLSNFDWYNW